jgi:hypothetical protein
MNLKNKSVEKRQGRDMVVAQSFLLELVVKGSKRKEEVRENDKERL